MGADGMRAVKSPPQAGQRSQQSPDAPQQIGDGEAVTFESRVEHGVGADNPGAY